MSSQGELRKFSGWIWACSVAAMACASHRAAGARAFPPTHPFQRFRSPRSGRTGWAGVPARLRSRPNFVKPIWIPLCLSTVTMDRKAVAKRAPPCAGRPAPVYSAPDKGDESKIRRQPSNQVSRTFADHVLRFLGITKFRTLSQCATRRKQEAARQPAATVKRTGVRSLHCRQISGLKDRGVTAPICRRKSEIRSRAWSSEVSCPDGPGRSGLSR